MTIHPETLIKSHRLATAMYDGAVIVDRSVAQGTPIIMVSINYRLNGFGFMASKEIKAAGVGNLGLHDREFDGILLPMGLITLFHARETRASLDSKVHRCFRWGSDQGHTVRLLSLYKYRSRRSHSAQMG